MAQTDVASPPVLTVDRNALRIVLFGIPDAGKSSLLGALAQAAQIQEHVLNGHLTDLSQGLTALQHRLYEDTPRETLEEVVPYAVAFDPFTPVNTHTRNGRLEAVLVDCDGRVANDLLERRRSLDATGGDGTLAHAILEADALILAVDASAPAAQIDADFAEFGRFLRLLEQSRGRRSEVGGLPVFLVLTKCDLLAQPSDSTATWIEHIEERKRQVDQRFQEFLARHTAEGPLPFGSIDLHLWATAVKRPALTDSPARPRDPYGVAELFRQCLESADDFRVRGQRAQRRLIWTVAGTTGVLAAMVAAAMFLFAHRQESRTGSLASRVEIYRLTEENKTPAERLRGSLARRLSDLKELRNDPEFSQLPPADQQFIQERLTELEDYIRYRDKLRDVRLAGVTREADLRSIETRLKNELAVPPQYERAWAQTEAKELHDTLLKSVQALRLAVDDTKEAFNRWTAEGEELASFARNRPSDAPSWEEWLRRASDLTRRTTPHPESEDVPGARNLTYATVLRIDQVEKARGDWEAVKQRLERLRNLVAALGIAGRAPDGERQPLDIRDRFSLAQARTHWQRLENMYPRLAQEIPTIELPAAVAGEIRRTARASYDHLIETGREAVLAQLQQASLDGNENRALWEGVRPWLTNPEELREWRVLATALAQVQNPTARDPVIVLAEFLGKSRFDLDVQRLTLEVPYDRKLRPAGAITVYHGPATGEAPAVWVFKLIDEDGRRDPQRRVTVYDFLRDTAGPLVYVPGDKFSAHAPIKKDGDARGWMLTWARSRSEMYQFECLIRPARLHRADQSNLEGEVVNDLPLTALPERGLPRVPDLVPVVKLRKR